MGAAWTGGRRPHIDWAAMTDFWRDSGYHLLERTESGHLAVTDDYLRAYYLRPEVRPVAESCAAERALHEALLTDPRLPVPESRIAALADPDAREAYTLVLRFRDRLLVAGTVEGCYLQLFAAEGAAGPIDVPPLFVDQMAHVILRGILEGCADGLRARAAETLFRAQRVTIRDEAVMAADAETVEMHAATGGFGDLGRLIVDSQTAPRTVELDVLSEANAELYWGRERNYDTVLDLTFAGGGLDALCRVLEAWVGHFLDVKISVQPVQRISDDKWVWHLGLDAESTRLLNDLYEGVDVGEARRARLLSLFRLEFADPAVPLPSVAGRPVYMAMCMSEDNLLRLKPQNLLLNLPLHAPS